MEQIAVYGWGMVAILIVGVVLWQMGVFSGGSTSATFTGFGPLKPVEWSCNSANDVLALTVLNGAGGQISNVNISIGAAVGACASTDMAAGATALCTITSPAGSSCANAVKGASYSQDVAISYLSPAGQFRSSTGTVKGPAD